MYLIAIESIWRLFCFVQVVKYERTSCPLTGWGTNGFKVKIEKMNVLFVICSRCRKNLKFGGFTLFRGVRQRNARKFVLHLQHAYECFSFFNQSCYCFLTLLLPQYHGIKQRFSCLNESFAIEDKKKTHSPIGGPSLRGTWFPPCYCDFHNCAEFAFKRQRPAKLSFGFYQSIFRRQP